MRSASHRASRHGAHQCGSDGNARPRPAPSEPAPTDARCCSATHSTWRPCWRRGWRGSPLAPAVPPRARPRPVDRTFRAWRRSRPPCPGRRPPSSVPTFALSGACRRCSPHSRGGAVVPGGSLRHLRLTASPAWTQTGLYGTRLYHPLAPMARWSHGAAAAVSFTGQILNTEDSKTADLSTDEKRKAGCAGRTLMGRYSLRWRR